MSRTDIVILRNDIVSGIIRGNITYTIERDSVTRKVNVHGEAYELIVPAEFREIYESDAEYINENSVFDIVIKQSGRELTLKILKDVYIWPRPSCYFVGEKVVVVDNFKFRSW